MSTHTAFPSSSHGPREHFGAAMTAAAELFETIVADRNEAGSFPARLDSAREQLLGVFADPPATPELARLIGDVLLDCGCHAESARAYRVALTQAPSSAPLCNDYAMALFAGGREQEGIEALRQAIRHEPRNVHWHLNLGTALLNAGQGANALRTFDHALSLDRTALQSWGPLHEEFDQLADWLRQQGRAEEAIAWHRRALGEAPERADLHNNLGSTLLELRRYADARVWLEKAVAIDPTLAAAHGNLGTILELQGQLVEALSAYRRATQLAPDFLYARMHSLGIARMMASWENWDSDIAGLLDTTPRPGNTAPQVDLLYLPLSAAQLRMHAEVYSADQAARVQPQRFPTAAKRDAGDNRIRIGYVSDELRRHASGSLMVEAIELHDRKQFDVHVYDWGRDDGSVVERRVRAAAGARHDIRSLSPAQIAEKIAADGIDILVDLKGHTLDARLDVFAMRPAPVQVNWLGYPGTLGTRCHDYLIADGVVVPPRAEQHYSEKIVRLPDSYQPNDRQRHMASPRTRTAYGLPADDVVFCYLGKPSKILPEVLDDWMTILREVPKSALWILEEGQYIRTNLLSAAAQAGIDTTRLRFAKPIAHSEHLARFKVADIALDTWPYNSHTTASEALWAGCPIVTRAGETFASRVATSLLNAAAVPELCTEDRESYRQLAITLGNDRPRTRALRQKIETNRNTCALFDTPRFVRNLEQAYRTMHEKARQGLPAEGFDVGGN